MQYRRLGDSGLEVSAIGLGTNNFGDNSRWPFHMGPDEVATLIHASLDVGVNTLDTANAYGEGRSEEYIGRALKGRREDAVIATKVHGRMGEGPNREGLSRKAIMYEVEQSLRRLQTDYIDLYQLHQIDHATPIEETMRALDDLVRDGKVRYVGCSNFEAWRLCEAVWTARTAGLAPMVSVQPPYSMLNRDVERELLPVCDRYGVGVLPYFPLEHGLLTGKYRRGQPPPSDSRLAVHGAPLKAADFDLIEDLAGFAEGRGHTLLELAFAWLLSRPSVSSVIAGATRPEQ
ncbi:MAG: aldo/keto reductase, partial [Dehalococcoidia bacterium]|nr:aldo/keto reductase [Dehalococcoidia bacterium]